MVKFIPIALALLATTQALAAAATVAPPAKSAAPIYIYKLAPTGNADYYDELIAVTSIQGILNRKTPTVYLLNEKSGRPGYWLDVMSKDGRWLQGRKQKSVPNLDALVKLAGKRLKGAVIWDPSVPATVNVADTIAGVEDLVALSPEYADRYLAKWGLKAVRDLRGMFTGKETGSKKNDAYRWAIREYLAKGKCSPHIACLYMDAFGLRETGAEVYTVTRDWAVSNRSFVYDLSPWGDEVPGDDPNQPMGTDLATYKMMLQTLLQRTNGKQMTEVTGFFNFGKYSNMPGHPSRHDPVPTEWETVWLISPYNCYQNTATELCYNQSFHSHAPFTPLKQRRPTKKLPLENKAYVAILMADYDSAYPLYDFLPVKWADKDRGSLPLNWGINPNLIETYPDVISYFYETAGPNDHFVADASSAGYINPNRVQKQYLPLLVKHNKKFYNATDMTISGMVLDWDQPSADVKDAFTQFSPDGFATIVMDLHGNGGRPPTPHMWKGMPVTELLNNADISDAAASAKAMADAIRGKDPSKPGFYYFRRVWITPGMVQDSLAELRKQLPGTEIEVVDLYSFFDLFRRSQAQK